MIRGEHRRLRERGETIYGIRNAEGRYIYVGLTRFRLQERIWGHLSPVAKRPPPINIYLSAHAHECTVEALEFVPEHSSLRSGRNGASAEREWIILMIVEGEPLLNISALPPVKDTGGWSDLIGDWSDRRLAILAEMGLDKPAAAAA